MTSSAVTDSVETRVHVGQGEHFITSDPNVVLSTILGSCVAMCLRDPLAGVGGMNHFLLPEGAGAGTDAGRRYGAYAMELLINDLLKAGGRRERLEAKLFGGGRMFDSLRDVGRANADFAERALSYLVFLGAIGCLMLNESLTEILRRRRGVPAPRKDRRRPMWLYGLPLRMKFPKSGLYISALPPFGLGVFAGVLSAIMGVGGGFILVPAMLYILRMRAGAVVGTSLFQIIITTAITTILQAGRNQTVDVVLSTILLLGGVVGAQIGARFAGRFRAEELRAALGLIVLLVGIQMGLELFVRPADIFMLAPGIPE